MKEIYEPLAELRVTVQGYTSSNRLATFRTRFLSALTDILCVVFITILTLWCLDITPVPRFSILVLFIAIGILYGLPQKFWFHITLGERIWHLRVKSNDRLYEQDYLSPVSLLHSSFLTLLPLALSIYSVNRFVLNHPVWLKASLWELTPYIPLPENWQVAPLFYTIGAWPKQFLEHPIYNSLPYEYGPPTRFVGHVISHWTPQSINGTDESSIRFIIEGPKTPEPPEDPVRIRQCFTQEFGLACISLRDRALSRHIQELQLISPYQWTIQWFHVKNTYLPLEDQVQGVYLSATGEQWIQDRFIAIHASGTHQAFILIRPKSDKGEQAFALAENIIRSLRSFRELDPGKAWIDREIEDVKLSEIKSVAEFAQVQRLLISKITVDPGNLESYFHLAGTSFMLLKNKLTQITDPVGNLAVRNIESAYKYSRDLAPQDPKTSQIERMWLETRELLSQ